MAFGFGGLGLFEAMASEAPGAAEAELWRGATRVGDVPFAAEPDDPLGTPIASGLDARLYTDFSKLAPDRLITPVEEFFIRTETPDGLDSSGPERARAWRIRIGGLVSKPSELALEELAPDVEAMGVHLIECAGNTRWTRFGLMSAADWSGVPISKVLGRVGVDPAARILVGGFDAHSRPSTNSTAGCSWIFTREQLEAAGAFLATRMNGRELTSDHGHPVRLVVPGWYGCCCIKWVDRIEGVSQDRPATSQMREFALRTHQGREPQLAAEYQPATVDRAAMPVRVEKWRLPGDKIRYRVVGVDWGGDRKKGKLRIRFRPDAPFEEVRFQPASDNPTSWALWSHPWEPPAPGRYLIQIDIDDPSIRAFRLRSGFYLRGVSVDAV